MAIGKVRKGDTVSARVHQNGVKSGTLGKVVGVYSGTFYAVSFPGIPGVCYCPDAHVVQEKSGSPTAVSGPGSGTSLPTAGVSAAQDHIGRVGAWEGLMSKLSGVDSTAG